jgi:poly(3-hydroxyalkanoate) depolymerase
METATIVRTVVLDGRRIRVGIRPGAGDRTPLVILNGIGANLELMEPFTTALTGMEIISFDVPGVGGSDPPARPYRFRWLARLVHRLLDALGYHGPVDVLGVSWGGALAQQFAFQYGPRCRKLVLAATSPGALMLPGRIAVIARLLSPRRYRDPAYLQRVGGQLYGGLLRRRPELLCMHAHHMTPPRGRGYLYQLLAAWGWTSIWWLRALRQPTLVLAGRDDPIVPLANAFLMTLLLRGARLEVLDDGHLFVVTQPELTAALVDGFLGGADARISPA